MPLNKKKGGKRSKTDLVQAALRLGLVTRPPTRALSLALPRLLRRMPIPNRFVPLLQQRVTRHARHVDVVLHFVEAPPAERVDLDQTGRVDLDRLEGSAVGALGATTTGDGGANVQGLVGAAGGLDLRVPETSVRFVTV